MDLKISLAAARVNACMTQDEAAKSMNVSKRTIVNWEKGKVKPTLASLKALAELYKMPIEYIFLPDSTHLK